MAGCIVARHINGITLNGYEFLLERDEDGDTGGTILVFESKKEAVKHLRNHGITEDEIYYMRFLDADEYLLNRHEIDL